MKNLENKILELAKIEEGRFIIKPQIITDGSFDYIDGEFKSLCEDIYTKFLIEILIVDSCDKVLEKIGYAEISLIHADEYLDDTFWMLEAHNQEHYEILEAINYIEHINNYKEYGFNHPYQSFLILDRLLIKEPYRKLGLGKAIVISIKDLVSCFIHKNNIGPMFWQAYPLYDAKLETQEQINKEAIRLVEIYKKMGAKKISNTGNDNFFYY